MSNSFENKLGSNTYPSILHMGFDAIGLTANLRYVYDGAGNQSPLKLSLTQVSVGNTVISADGYFTFGQLAAQPTFPSSGNTQLYARTNEKLYYQNNDGIERPVVTNGESQNGDVDLFDSVSSDNTLRFNGLSAADNRVTITGGGEDSPVLIGTVEANFTLNNISGILSLAKGGTGSNITTPSEDALYGYDFSGTASIGFTLTDGIESSGTTIIWSNYNSSFLTIDDETTLPGSRNLLLDTGLTFTDGGSGSTYTLSLELGTVVQIHSDTLDSLAENVTNGILCYTASSTVTARTLTAGTNIAVTNGDGVSGNPTVALTGQVAAANGGTGLSTTTAYGLLTGGTTDTGNFQNVGTGTANYMLQSNGPSALPSYVKPDLMAVVPNNISTRWYKSSQVEQINSTLSTFLVATGTLYYVPFFVTSPSITYTDIGVYISSGGGGNTNFGIYNSSATLTPTGSPITNSTSGNVANGASGAVTHTFSSPITLTKGIYWLAFTTDDASINYVSMAIAQTIGLGSATGPGAATSDIMYYTQAFTYSATLPTAASLSAVTTVPPLLLLKAQ